MTREEAIEVLKEYRTIVMYHLEAETPAFDMAIEALQADAVSRDVYDKRIKADEKIIDSYREKLANCHKEILRLLDFNDDIERQNDVIEVVRCKDCRHRVHDEERYLYYCEMYYGQGDVSDKNFCQWGERREPDECE